MERPSGTHDRDVVVRIEPTSHQLFVEPDALRQAQVMSALAGHVPVPPIWLTERDPDVLGAPFFLMERVEGRIPSDVPSWHAKGWTTELDVGDRRRLHDNALAELARLHHVDTTADTFAFLEFAGEGTALDRYVAHVHTWYEWCEPVRKYGTDIIDAAMEHVLTAVPADDRRGVVWGDARVGNIIFGGDLSVRAMLDWEGATLGPPEVDVTWWVMFDEFLCEAQGITRLDGVHDRPPRSPLRGARRGTAARHRVLRGACRAPALAHQQPPGRPAGLNRQGTESVAAEFVTRVTELTRRALERSG